MLRAAGPFCTIRYADLYGKRTDKFAFLESHDLASVEWQTLKPQAPMYFFVPKDFSLQEEYEKGFKITDLMPLNGMGITTAHDDFVYGGCDELFERFSRFKNSQAHENLYQKFNVSEKAGWDILKGHSALQGISDLRSLIKPIAYRPFDDKFVFYEDRLVWRSVRQIFKHFSLKPEGFVQTGLTGFTGLGVDGNPDNPVNPVKKDSASSAPPRLCVENNRTDNLALCLLRINRGDNAVSVFVTDKITDKTILSSKDNATVFPLYLYHEDMGQLVREPNLNPEIVARLEDAMQNAECRMQNDEGNGENLNRLTTQPLNTGCSGRVAPEDILHYVYAVLHSPSYRERFGEFLKVDFPRIPYPKDGEEFRRLAAIGAKLVETHLMRDPPPPLTEKTASFPVAGGNVVEEVRWELCHYENMGLWDNENMGLGNSIIAQSHNSTIPQFPNPCGRVFINAAQYFDNVPKAAWEFFVGGYQPAQKWLKDRKGCALSADDLLHYKRIILAMQRTGALMAELRMDHE